MLGAESQLWEVTRKSTVLNSREGCWAVLIHLPSSVIRVSRELVNFLLLHQLGDTQTNGDFPY